MSDSYKHALFWTRFPEEYKPSYLGFLTNDPLPLNLFPPKPTMIYTGNNRILELDDLHLPKNLVASLNQTGLSIYLYEPACYRLAGKEHNRSFYSELDYNVSSEQIRCDELDSISDFAVRNSLTDITVLTGDYRVQELSQHYPNLKLCCYDIFLRTQQFGPDTPMVKIINRTKKRIKRFLFPDKIKKRFWSGNWRYTAHRHLVAAYLATLDGTYSWNFSGGSDHIKQVFWFDIGYLNANQTTRLINGATVLDNSNFTIDKQLPPVKVTNPNNVHIPNASVANRTDEFLRSYVDCFCAVVTETRYAQPYSNLSEKTLTAIYALRPFILVAPPYSLEYLKTFGFKTFSQWLDESYDRELDHGKRMAKIFSLIDFINNKSIDELQAMYNEMKPVLYHNERVLRTVVDSTKIV